MRRQRKTLLRLMTALAAAGLPVPLPEPGRDGLRAQPLPDERSR